MATDLLAKIRSELDERLAQLRPLLDEYERLRVAADRLAAVDADAAGAATPAVPHARGTATAERTVTARAAGTAERTPHARTTGTAQRTPLQSTPYDRAIATAERTLHARTATERTRDAQAFRRGRPPGSAAPRAIKLAMSLRTTPVIPQAAPTPVAKTYEPAAPTPLATRSLEQRTPLPGAPQEDGRAASTLALAELEPRRKAASPAAVQQAILAALDHGSHTASELVMVTAMSAGEIRGSLGRLAGRGSITKVKRRGDGKTAYALPSAPA